MIFRILPQSKNKVPYHRGIWLEQTLAGVDKATPPESIREQCPPVTVDMLWMLNKDLQKDEPFDAAVLAITKTAFYGQLRLGEILLKAKNVKLYDFSEKPAAFHLHAHSRTKWCQK